MLFISFGLYLARVVSTVLVGGSKMTLTSLGCWSSASLLWSWTAECIVYGMEDMVERSEDGHYRVRLPTGRPDRGFGCGLGWRLQRCTRRTSVSILGDAGARTTPCDGPRHRDTECTAVSLGWGTVGNEVPSTISQRPAAQNTLWRRWNGQNGD
uniref:Putative secreted protein n=1 Tax=Ixodes ricinus TaxID=34613 RepID=A0A6B0UWK1_IXORI